MMPQIRPAGPDDAETLDRLIRELAAYEKLEADVQATPELLRKYLFGPHQCIEALVAEQNGEAVGFALYFFNFSTFRCLPGLYLEDIYVKPEFRGQGLGTALFRRLAAVAMDRGCGRLEWSVLDWNEPAIGFYQSLGARAMDEWTIHRLEGEPLERLARLNPESAT